MFSTVAIVASCAAFVVIGALQALYGPAIPALRQEFGISPAVAGFSLSGHFIGALLGVLVYHMLRGRLNNRALLAVSYLFMAVGAFLFALSPSWALALIGTFFAGLGYGGIDYGLNQLFAIGFGSRSTAMLNLLNGGFGVGAVVGPVLIGGLGAENYPWIFAAVGIMCALILLTLRGVAAWEPSLPGEGAARNGGARVLPIIASFIGIYVFHVAIETGVGGWEPTHLQAVGYGAAIAASATSAYWLAMTIGRFVVIPLSLRWSASAILNVCCAGMAVFLLLATIPVLAPYAYFGVGLMIAPIFPTCLPWLSRAVPSMSGASAYVIAASMLGGVAFPPLLGGVIDTTGVKFMPVVLFVLAVLCVVLGVWLSKNAPDHGSTTNTSGSVKAKH